MESRQKTVYDNHYSGCNCAQSVFTAYHDLFGDMDRDTAMRLSLSFGGGAGRTQEGMCGALCGAIMLLGLKYGPASGVSPEAIWEHHRLVRRFIDDFTAINGGFLCKDIIKCDITTPEKYAAAHDNFEEYCVPAIMSAAELLEERYGMLEGQEDHEKG